MGPFLDISGPMGAALRLCKPHFLMIAVLSALINILYLAPSLYMLQVYDRVLPTGGRATLFWLVLLTLFSLVTLSVFDAIRMRLLVKVGVRLESILVPQLLNQAMVSKPKRATPQLLRDFDLVRAALSGTPVIVLFDLPWAPVYVLVAGMLHPVLALLVLGGGAILVCVTLWSRRVSGTANATADAYVRNAYAMSEAISAETEVVRALGMQSAMVQGQIRARQHGQNLLAAMNLRSGHFVAAGRGLRLFLQIVALAVGALLVIDNRISAGAMIAVSILMTRALQPVEQLIGALAPLDRALSAWILIQSVLRHSDADTPPVTKLPAPRGRITLRDVSVRLDESGDTLLENVSLSFQPGRIVGVVGPSGSGKSTLARTIVGVITPLDGRIELDGASLSDWDPEILGEHMGYLPQDVGLLPGTIAENICRFAPRDAGHGSYIDKQIVSAARLAGAHSVIMGLKGAYDRRIGENGEGLSAGQRQLIGLARAFFRAPPILVLDEPNTALDGNGEASLIRAIRRARSANASVVLIAHKVSILAEADEIIVLRNGKVKELGPAANVLAKLRSSKPAAPKPDVDGAVSLK